VPDDLAKRKHQIWCVSCRIGSARAPEHLQQRPGSRLWSIGSGSAASSDELVVRDFGLRLRLRASRLPVPKRIHGVNSWCSSEISVSTCRSSSGTAVEVYRSWLASRPGLSAKVRRGYEDIGDCAYSRALAHGQSRGSSMTRFSFG